MIELGDNQTEMQALGTPHSAIPEYVGLTFRIVSWQRCGAPREDRQVFSGKTESSPRQEAFFKLDSAASAASSSASSSTFWPLVQTPSSGTRRVLSKALCQDSQWGAATEGTLTPGVRQQNSAPGHRLLEMGHQPITRILSSRVAL